MWFGGILIKKGGERMRNLTMWLIILVGTLLCLAMAYLNNYLPKKEKEKIKQQNKEPVEEVIGEKCYLSKKRHINFYLMLSSPVAVFIAALISFIKEGGAAALVKNFGGGPSGLLVAILALVCLFLFYSLNLIGIMLLVDAFKASLLDDKIRKEGFLPADDC